MTRRTMTLAQASNLPWHVVAKAEQERYYAEYLKTGESLKSRRAGSAIVVEAPRDYTATVLAAITSEAMTCADIAHKTGAPWQGVVNAIRALRKSGQVKTRQTGGTRVHQAVQA